VVNKKIQAALRVGLKPILCVGEKLEENEAGRTEKVIVKQLRSSLSGIGAVDDLIIAYEPIWAIGTGRAATSKQANETISFIRHNVAKLYDEDIAQRMRILYGGSVNAANAAEFLSQPEIDGALVGRASLKASEFISIVKQASEIRQAR
jgi:triosephosphate isomerase